MLSRNFTLRIVVAGMFIWMLLGPLRAQDTASGPTSREAAPPAVVAVRPVVRGVITDENGPISGANLIIEVTDMGIRRVVFTTRARTDLRGTYEADLSPVKAQALGIQVNAVDETHEEAMKIEIIDKAALPIDISMELRPGRSVSGHVYDDAGKPVKGAQVEVPYVRPVTSEFDGFYSIQGVPVGQSLAVMARADGYSPETREVESESSQGAVSEVDFHLKPERMVHGLVTDPHSKPVKGADVTLYLPLQRVWRTSDEKGEFLIDNLPYEASQAMVVANHPDFAPYEEQTEIREGNTSLTIQLDFGATLEGTVTADPAGTPLAGASIGLSLPEARPSLVGQTDALGHFRAKNLPEGRIVVTAYPPGEDSLERTGEWLVEQTGSLLKGDVNPWPDQRASDFRGSVLKDAVVLERRDRGGDDPSNPDASIAADYTGKLSEDGLGIKGTFKLRGVDREGTWEASRPGGGRDRLTGLWTWTEKLGASKTHLAPVHATVELQKDKTATRDLRMAAGWDLTGVVRDPENQPVADARVSVIHWDDLPAEDLGSATTDAEGKFTLSTLPAGKLDVVANKPALGGKLLTFDQPRPTTDPPAEFVLTTFNPMAGSGEPSKAQDLFSGSPKVGEKAPEFTVTALDGTVFDLSKLQGKVVLIDFWASWCGPCVAEMPTLRKVYEKYGNRSDFVIFSVSLDFNEADLKKAMEKYEVKWPQVFDGKAWETDLGLKYGVMSIPRSYLIDRKGNVAADQIRGDEILKAVEETLEKP